MCAAALSILAPARVVFGCHNPRFGGVGSVLDVVAGRFPGCGLRHEEGGGEAGAEGAEGAGAEGEAGRGSGGEHGGGEGRSAAADGTEGTTKTRVGALHPPDADGRRQQTDDGQRPSSLPGTARPYRTLGGVLAAEAVALLKEFYETGNPSAPRPNRPAAAAATRAARKAAAAAAAAAGAAAAGDAAAAAAALAAEAAGAASCGGGAAG